MNRRQQQKQETRARLLEAAAARLRAQGRESTGVAEVMADVGLTHGGFYGHFAGKDELLEAAFRHAMTGSREDWFSGLEDAHGLERLRWLAGRYLSRRHRDRPEDGCALAAVAGDASRPSADMRVAYEEELLRSLARLSEGMEAQGEGTEPVNDGAIAFLALCMGGLLMSRAVADPALSERILRACRQLAPRLAADDTAADENHNETRSHAAPVTGGTR